MQHRHPDVSAWVSQPVRPAAQFVARPTFAQQFQSTVSEFDAWAAKCPHAEAVRTDHGSVSYQALQYRANGIAARLLQLVPRDGRIVPLALPHGADKIAAALAVAKAGLAWVPLDMSMADERLAELLDCSDIRCRKFRLRLSLISRLLR